MHERSVFSTLLKIGLPAAIGLFFNTMLNVVDTYFAAKSSTLALAAMSLSFPLFLFIVAISEGLSTAASALISYHHGQNNIKEARKMGAQVLVYGVFSSVVLTVFGVIFSEKLFILLGASDSYLSLARAYMDPIFLGSALFVFSSAINGILLAKGDARPLRDTLIASFFLNCLLDPWFLYGGFGLPAMGLKGIALATLVSKAFALVYLVFVLWHRYNLVDKNLRDYIPVWADMGRIFLQQVPAALNTLTIALGLFVANYFLKPFGQEATAAYGASLRIEQIFLLPIVGIQVATVSVVGHSYGARDFSRIRQTFFCALAISLFIATIGAFMLYTIPEVLLGAFTEDRQVVLIGSAYLKIASLISWAYILGGISLSVLQGIHKPLFPIVNGLFRQFIGRVFLIQWMLIVFAGGIKGIWWGIFFSNWIFSLIAILYMAWRLSSVQKSLAPATSF